jgi:hypothetical protein
MPYVVYARYGTQPKNKLQQAILDLVLHQDRLLLSDLEAVKFKSLLQQDIDGLNDKFKTCRPAKPYWWMPFDWIKEEAKHSYRDEKLQFEDGGYGFVECSLLYCQKPA